MLLSDVLDTMRFPATSVGVGIRPLRSDIRVAGRAFTMKCVPVNQVPNELYVELLAAYATMQAGDVVVLEAWDRGDFNTERNILPTDCVVGLIVCHSVPGLYAHGREKLLTFPDGRRGRTSLRDVAKLAGVSTATASRVLSGSSHPVSTNTRNLVLSVAERMAFKPNRLARALVTARSQVIGVIVHDISDPYFGGIVRGLEDGLNLADYRLLVASSDRDARKELQYLETLIAQQVDGIVFAASSIADSFNENKIIETVARYRREGGSVVLLSEHAIAAPRVVFDNRDASRDMVAYLVAQGHRRVAYLSGPSDLRVSRTRLEGYQQGVGAAGIPYDPSLVADGGFTIDGGGEAIGKLLKRVDFTAVFASNDLMAIGATRALLNCGVDVPGKVSVAGFDDIILAEYGPIPLTTVRMPTHEIGLKGANLILSLLRGENPEHQHVDGSIIRRSSVAPPVGA